MAGIFSALWHIVAEIPTTSFIYHIRYYACSQEIKDQFPIKEPVFDEPIIRGDEWFGVFENWRHQVDSVIKKGEFKLMRAKERGPYKNVFRMSNCPESPVKTFDDT